MNSTDQCMTRIDVQGVIVYFRVVDGEMRVGDTVKLINTGKEHQIGELGVLAPKPVQVRTLRSLQAAFHRSRGLHATDTYCL